MISIIAALDPNGVIGYNNTIPWDIPKERHLFRKLTTGNVVIMGRKTFESIGKPLPDRVNIVVSRTVSSLPGVEVYPSLKKALALAKTYKKDIFIIGGAKIYEQALQLAEVDTMHVSHIHSTPDINMSRDGIVSFPDFDKNEWEITEKKQGPLFDFVTYTRRTKKH